ncbi:hypothetical protein [Lacipirellula sp.]|uniref:hypothetical protein n=1 Tax=Lacipirellula sp. TaxID=2691419 RepID=UPI003D0A65E7
MINSETTALRMVEGGELYLRRESGVNWQVEFYDRIDTAVVHRRIDGFLRSKRITNPFPGATFKSPQDAAAAFRRLIVL